MSQPDSLLLFTYSENFIRTTNEFCKHFKHIALCTAPIIQSLNPSVLRMTFLYSIYHIPNMYAMARQTNGTKPPVCLCRAHRIMQ